MLLKSSVWIKGARLGVSSPRVRAAPFADAQ
jgi:hypothetical protein